MNFKKYLFILLALLSVKLTSAQTTDDILNLLVKRGTITQSDADSLKANKSGSWPKTETRELFPLIGSTPFRVGGYMQSRFQSFQQAGVPDGFDIHRARIILDGNTPLWEYRLNAEFASSPKLIDAYITFKPYDFLKVTSGQFYIPFSVENVTADRELTTIDRSQVVTALAGRDKDVIGNQNGRDVGIQLSGSFVKLNGGNLVDYYVGYFNGSGINVADNNEAKDVSSRIVFHPFTGFNIGGSYYNGYGQWSAGTPAKVANRIRTREGGEVSYKYKLFSIQGEYIQGQDGNITELDKTNAALKRAGWYALAGYFIVPKKLQIIARYDTYDPNTVNNEKLIAGSTSDISTYYVGGLNYYFTDWIKLQADYSYRREQVTQINNDLISAQLQIIF